MVVLGITGSIGMGKTTISHIFKEENIPVFCADAAVHDLYKEKKIIDFIKSFFPTAVCDGTINRKVLASLVFENDKGEENLRKIEKIIHPLIRKKEQKFISTKKQENYKLIALDIPLLFETKAEKLCDKILVVTAPFDLQKKRVLQRGQTEKSFLQRLQQQLSDEEKKRRADYIIDTSHDLEHTKKQVKNIIQMLTQSK